jgi:hypothetical protein
MRLAVLLLLILPAWAGPYARWFDATGGVQEAPIAEVVSENAAEVSLTRRDDGKTVTVPTHRLILLVREDESDVDQRTVLLARLAALHGEPSPEASALLERLAVRTKPPWLAHYAAAARALSAVTAGEKDAGERVAAFRKAHPRSRFTCAVDFALVRADAYRVTGRAERGELMLKAFRDLGAAGAPLGVQYATLPTAGELLLATGLDRIEYNQFSNSMAQTIAQMNLDAAQSVVFEATKVRVKLVLARHTRKKVSAAGEKPFGAAERVRKLEARNRFLPRELRFDVLYELGEAYAACGLADRASQAYDSAFRLAPDPWRRARAARKRKPR